jgi:hypothetical protein
MERREANTGQPENSDLVWNLDHIARREAAEEFIRLFENRLCVFSESARQLYTNYNLHFPSELGRRMVVLSNPYAFHDTLHGIDANAVHSTGLYVMAGRLHGKKTLLLAKQLQDGDKKPRTMPFKQALAQIISNQKKLGEVFLPVLVKGDLREFGQQLPYLHLHRLQISKLGHLSSFERDDIQNTITRKLLLLYRQADSLLS